MAKINWIVAKADYIKDQTLGYRDIAKKYGVSLKQVSTVAKKENWTELRHKTASRLQQILPEKISDALGESIAQVKVRHAKIGRVLQEKGLKAISAGVEPHSFKDARLSIVSGVMIEQDALGIGRKEVEDEIAQKFSQFTFIFNLTPDELRRFIKAAFARGGYQISDIRPDVSQPSGEGNANQPVESVSVAG